MSSEIFADSLSHSPPLWIQTEEDVLTSWRALGARAGSDLLAITSGGCTPLSFLALGARSVVAVDVNSTQTMVLEIKRAMMAALSRESSLDFLGVSNTCGNQRRFETLRSHLEKEARDYWDQNATMFLSGPFIESGGMQGVGTELRQTNPHGATKLCRLFECSTLDDQITYYSEHIAGSIDWEIAQLRQNRAEHFFGAGVQDEADDRKVADEMCRQFVEQLRHSCHTYLLRTSPWAHHMLLGYYAADTLPLYLTPTGFTKAAAHLSGLRAITGDVLSVLGDLPSASLDGIDISNICDLLSWKDWEALAETAFRVLRSGGRLVRRNFIMQTPFDTPDYFLRHGELSDVLTRQDKSILYRAIVTEEPRK